MKNNDLLDYAIADAKKTTEKINKLIKGVEKENMRHKKLKYVNEWGLDKRATRIVKRELGKWIEAFIERADNARFQVEECNFKENKLFFFTTCHDVLKDEPEETGIESSIKIRKRKRQICYALLLKQLIGADIRQWSHKCSHCGNTNMIIEGVGNSSYHRHCPDCNRFVIDTFGSDFHLMARDVYNKYLKKKEVEK